MVIRMMMISPHRDKAVVKTDGRYYMLSMYEEINNQTIKYEELEMHYRLGYTPTSVILSSMETAWEYLYNKYKKHQVNENPMIANTQIADGLYEKYRQKR